MAEITKEGKLERLRSAVRQQKGKLYIIKKCIALLICRSAAAQSAYGSFTSSIMLHACMFLLQLSIIFFP
ncbi:hypothetical protein BRADI_2g26214v3 [Brachypodium distachyon]|uniref:Uncharacterized protein n=1 Tax=Brachypodium distachyon TaxID=15368 RepID=A0A0Q3K6E3_BRADI|nr:hypothetical protein BRADI_2g26214v3 [Brachypodium distachyon]